MCRLLKAMPTKRIHVMPSDTPPILILPSRMPSVMVNEKISIAWATPLPKKRDSSHSIDACFCAFYPVKGTKIVNYYRILKF